MSNDTIRVLYVEDDPYDVTILQETLRSTKGFQNEYTIDHAGDLIDGLNMVGEHHYDAILLDLNLPEGAGEKNVKIFKKHAPQTPIICLTSTNCDRLAMEALREGAQEFIVKGYGNAYVLNRIIRSSIFRQNIENALRNQAQFDNNTGLPNNVFLSQTVNSFIKKAEEWGHQDAMMIMSISNFKNIYAQFGREVAREVGIRTVKNMREGLREEFAGSLNEGEFLIYVHNNALHDIGRSISDLSEKLIDRCSTQYSIKGRAVDVTVNIGAAVFPDTGQNYDALLDSAYDALFIATSYGHSKYCMANEELIEPAGTRAASGANL